MAASPPLVTSDILNPEASPSPRINENDTREGIASVISTIRAQIADQPAGAMGPVSQPPAMANAVTGSTPPVPVHGGAPTASSQRVVPSNLAPSPTNATTNASNGYPAAVPNRSHQPLVSPPLSGPAAAGQPGQKQFGPIAPKTAPSAEKTREYERLMDMVQNTDASVVRQVVRENWHKCLVGSDYHCGFIANAAINYSNPAVLSRTMSENGDKVLRHSKREIAKHFRGEDLDEIADIIGPKLGERFQDRVMATRLETIGAQDLINALARAERLGYHINDVVKKKPGQGGETVIPSISALLTSLPPVQPHQIHGGVPPPPMPPHMGPGPPQQPQQPPRAPQGQHPIPIMRNGNITFQPPSTPSQSPTAGTPVGNVASLPHPHPNQTPGIMYCATCHRPCSSSDALSYPSNNLGPPSYHIPHQPATLAPAIIKSNITPSRRSVGSAPTASPSTNDPYAKLTPENRERFNAEMKDVEERYGRLRKEAEALPPGEREEELAKIKNRYNTKQSNTRKKYGIRLRERRTNADMERSWNADQAHSAKKARVGDGQARPTSNQVMESPRRRVPLAEMGGLSASSATAELVDPTASSTNSRPPPPAYGQPAAVVHGVQLGTYQGTPDDPMQIDDDTSTGTDSDNVDIPARI
ncbi:hypothetical protein Trihar35433_4892 [Trichoderma harzianum]|nr:hypothetical protein Trihar35433_4892 [Trichoderma harzianum]